MVAHMVFTKVRTIAADVFTLYMKDLRATFTGHEVKVISAFHPFEVLDGSKELEGTVILEFPSSEAAKRWYFSPSYQAARKLRLEAAEFNVVLLNEKQ